MAGVDTSQNKELEIKKCRVKILIKKKKKKEKRKKEREMQSKNGTFDCENRHHYWLIETSKFHCSLHANLQSPVHSIQ